MSEVECDPWCQRVLYQRGVEGYLDLAPIFENAATVHLSDLPIAPTGLIGGFPCQVGRFNVRFQLRQGTSIAGKQLGLDDRRSNLVQHIWRLWDEDPSRCWATRVTTIRF